MYTETELKAFSFIDDFLRYLDTSEDATVFKLGDTFYSKESQIAYKILCDKHLISFRKGFPDKNSIIDIAPNGIQILKLGGYKKYLELEELKEKNNEMHKRLEFRKTQIDIEMAEKVLKEYPKTKWMARISFAIALILAIFEIVKLLN